jgi:hypothetical protein
VRAVAILTPINRHAPVLFSGHFSRHLKTALFIPVEMNRLRYGLEFPIANWELTIENP